MRRSEKLALKIFFPLLFGWAIFLRMVGIKPFTQAAQATTLVAAIAILLAGTTLFSYFVNTKR